MIDGERSCRGHQAGAWWDRVHALLQCDPKTIRRGLAELDEAADLDTSRVRKRGWTQKLIEVYAALEENS